jgi:hypothetical protein
MSPRGWTGVLAAVLLAALAGAGVLFGLRPASADTLTTTAVFNNPTGTTADKQAIQNRIVDLINATPAGARIRMAMYYADDPTIPTALLAAKDRGVNVQAIFNNNDPTTTTYAPMVAVLGTDTSAASFILFCPPGRGCVGNRPLGTVDSLNHNKFFLFSSTSGASNVVVQSTANLHNGRDGLGGWNAALILVGGRRATGSRTTIRPRTPS